MSSSGSSKLIASNIKKIFENSYYLTETNDLYYYDGATSSLVKSNVKEYCAGYINGGLFYITQTNDYCYSYGNTTITIANNVKEGDYAFYLTQTNDYCYYNTDTGTTTTIASNVKEIYRDCYLTQTNDYCYYDITTGTIASNVKAGNKGFYITQANELYSDDGVLIASNVSRAGEYAVWYETISGDLYIQIPGR